MFCRHAQKILSYSWPAHQFRVMSSPSSASLKIKEIPCPYSITYLYVTRLSDVGYNLEKHPDDNIIHGIPQLLHAALEGFPIVSEFRRLNNHQMLVADFKAFGYSAEGNYYAAVDLITVMAPNEAIHSDY